MVTEITSDLQEKLTNIVWQVKYKQREFCIETQSLWIENNLIYEKKKFLAMCNGGLCTKLTVT